MGFLPKKIAAILLFTIFYEIVSLYTPSSDAVLKNH